MADARIDRPHLVWWLLVLGGMGTLGVLAFNEPALAWWTAHLFPLPGQTVLLAGFGVAVGLHAGEALYAHGLASRSGEAALAWAWALQTFILGYPSLRLLLARARAR